MTIEEEKLNENEQLALKIAEELSEGREFECDSLDIYKGAMKMADWKDQHPRKGLWDAEKVCKYLENHAGHYMTLENDEDGELQSVFYQKGLIEDLRKAMEGE